MSKRSKRLILKKKIRNQRRQFASFSFSANKQLDRHVFRRWQNVKSSQRFATAWISLLALLIVILGVQIRSLGSYYLQPTPVSGGLYSEGMVGTLSNVNPIYASSAVDTAVSKLIFSGLITFDGNNKPVGDLAQSWQINASATEYTIILKPNLFWQDGQKLTADDVMFTYQTMQNPDAQSPFVGNWSGVTLTKINSRTIKFVLPNSYAPFLNSLTTGILPKHLLSKVAPTQMRSISFNTTSPVGSGPFRLSAVTTNAQGQIIEMKKFDKYYRGVAKLDAITIRTYGSSDALLAALSKKQIITAAGIVTKDNQISSKYSLTSFNLMSANMLFLNNSSPVLGDVNVRKGLTSGTDIGSIMQAVGYKGVPVREPILMGQIGYNPIYAQSPYNVSQAKNLLDKAGWTVVPGKAYRQKNGQDLTLNITYQRDDELARIIDVVQSEWTSLGVHVNVTIGQDTSSAPKFLDTHQYDVLLYGINMGADPDGFAYWDSSQIGKKTPIHLNLSEYSSKVADLAIEGARINTDIDLRSAKYQPFLQAWQNDAPAIGLYQPRYLYISNQPIYGYDVRRPLNTPADRFDNVNEWMVNTVRTKDL